MSTGRGLIGRQKKKKNVGSIRTCPSEPRRQNSKTVAKAKVKEKEVANSANKKMVAKNKVKEINGNAEVKKNLALAEVKKVKRVRRKRKQPSSRQLEAVPRGLTLPRVRPFWQNMVTLQFPVPLARH